MQDKQKQIEEMAYSICTANRKLIKSCRECPIFQGDKYHCVKKEFAEKFYNAGCRMQSDTAREILQKLIYNITTNNTNDRYLSESIDYSSTIDDIKELAVQYGVEVEE